MIGLLAWSLVGCTANPPRCPTDDTLFVGSLRCDRAKTPARLLRLLSGRPLPSGSTDRILGDVERLFLAAPEEEAATLARLARLGADLERSTGLDGTTLRSRAIVEAVGPDGWATRGEQMSAIARSQLAVRALDPTTGLALTEVDIEGWITFASLAHEIRGAGPITVSIANRAAIYAMAMERFHQAEPEEQRALVALGIVWPKVVERWKAAPYAQQQRFIRRAVLPPLQGHTSLAWVEAVLEGDVVTNAAALHEVLGPLPIGDPRLPLFTAP